MRIAVLLLLAVAVGCGYSVADLDRAKAHVSAMIETDREAWLAADAKADAARAASASALDAYLAANQASVSEDAPPDWESQLELLEAAKDNANEAWVAASREAGKAEAALSRVKSSAAYREAIYKVERIENALRGN